MICRPSIARLHGAQNSSMPQNKCYGLQELVAAEAEMHHAQEALLSLSGSSQQVASFQARQLAQQQEQAAALHQQELRAGASYQSKQAAALAWAEAEAATAQEQQDAAVQAALKGRSAAKARMKEKGVLLRAMQGERSGARPICSPA